MNSPARGLTQAFTLIEIMVTVGIITILTGALIPSFVGYIDSQGLRQAQEQIKNDLRTAQNRALTNTQVGATEVLSWGVLFTNGSSKYQIIASRALNCDDASIAQRSDSEPLPDELPVQTSSGQTTQCIYFDRFGNSNTGCVRVSKGGQVRGVAVSGVGLVTGGEGVCP